MNIPLTVSLMIVSAVIGLAGGYFISPTYMQTMYTKEEMGLGSADRFVDLRYLNQMAAHHKGAILLANQIADKTQRVELKTLAADIQQQEPKLIDELIAWKKAWYNDSRGVTDPIVANLGTADATIDLRFLNALITHHEEGISMTREIKTKSTRSEVLNNADAVENFLKSSLVTLKGFREAWFNVK